MFILKRLLFLSVVLCSLINIVFASQVSSSFTTPLEKHYLNILLGKWHAVRTQHDNARGIDNDALQAKQPSGVRKLKQYRIDSVIQRKLVLGGQYLMVKDRITSNLGGSQQQLSAEHFYFEHYAANNSGKAWFFSSSGKEYSVTHVSLQALAHGGVRCKLTVNGQPEYWEVYPHGKNQLDIATYHIVGGKKLLVQTEQDTRVGDE